MTVLQACPPCRRSTTAGHWPSTSPIRQCGQCSRTTLGSLTLWELARWCVWLSSSSLSPLLSVSLPLGIPVSLGLGVSVSLPLCISVSRSLSLFLPSNTRVDGASDLDIYTRGCGRGGAPSLLLPPPPLSVSLLRFTLRHHGQCSIVFACTSERMCLRTSVFSSLRECAGMRRGGLCTGKRSPQLP